MKNEFVRGLLAVYDHAFEFIMPSVDVEAVDVEANDPVHRFVSEWVARDPDAYFTLEQARAAFSRCSYYNRKPRTFNNDLQKLLGACMLQKKIRGENKSSVWMGFRLRPPPVVDNIDG